MPAGSELHLVIPGACGPLADIQSLKDNATVENWIKVLTRANSSPSSLNVYEVVAGLFSLSIEGDFPVAALRMLAAGRMEPELNYMCADPVHLQADMDQAILSSSRDLAIREHEAQQLCDALNQHFQQDDIEFIRTATDSWVVASRKKIHINTTPLIYAVGRNINFILPQGDSSTYWKQVLTEAQMLMHAHEINEARESRGQQTINSLWLHGSGGLPEFNGCRISRVSSNNEIFKSLASHVQCDYLPVPGSAAETMEMISGGDGSVNLLHLSSLEHPVNYSDVNIWLAELSEVLNHWVYPLLKTAKKNNIKPVLYPCNGKQYRFSNYDDLKFWRKNKLEQHIDAY